MKLGIQSFSPFLESLAIKVMRRVLFIEVLWQSVMKWKYIEPSILEDWIRYPRKSFSGGSIVCKEVVKDFSIIGDRLSQLIGNGQKVHIGTDSWIGGLHMSSLSQRLISLLHFLKLVLFGSILWQEQWGCKHASQVGLNKDLALEWNGCVSAP